MTSHRSSPAEGFHRFGLRKALEEGIAEAGFTDPWPIQIQTIPAALEGRDVLGLAQTGTGKTAAFALPILEYLLEKPRPGPRALIVAPTRELARQIEEEFKTLAQRTRIRTVVVFGGIKAGPQINALRARTDIVVACPGRLLDLHGQGAVDLSGIEILVLDEADHMFDMGFLPDIRRILRLLPEDRQNLLFSATMPDEIRRLAVSVLHDPHVVELGHSAPAETVSHAFYPIEETRKQDLLEHLLAGDDFRSAIVFTRTKHRAKRLAKKLDAAGWKATALQGNMTQAQRDKAMEGFRNHRFNILVATDIAARGIDVARISHVINFDIPNTPEAYTHRIGRTGRAEREGQACTFVTEHDRAMVRAIERLTGERIEAVEVPGFEGAEIPREPVRPPPPPRPTSGGRGSGPRGPGGPGGSGASGGGRRRRRRGKGPPPSGSSRR